jgi:hypothetical protein
MPLAPFYCFGGSGCGLIMTREPGITVWAEAIAVALSAIAKKLVAKKLDLRNMTISYG